MTIKGTVKKDKKTKNLVSRLESGDIALISHKDLDEVAAYSLLQSKVKCVINTEKFISGRYPNEGPSVLVNNNIPIYECDDKTFFELVKDNEKIEIVEDKIILNTKESFDCRQLDHDAIKNMLYKSYLNINRELENFIDNTLEYAKKEKELVIGNLKIPPIETKIANRHALIVVRGKDYKKDLEAIRVYIKEKKPILIGVDGGGDALLEFGYTPDIIIGDMDSVSDRCLRLSKEIIVHAYTTGEAPGLKRINRLNLKAKKFPAPGTSEDIALLLSYHYKADLIVAVGTHSNMIDFLEKGRSGMASTLLVRLKVGSKLVDAKGVNKIYKTHLEMKYMLSLGFAALLPILVLSIMFPPLKEILQLIQIRLKLILGL